MVPAAVVGQVWPLLALLALLGSVAAVYAARTGDRLPLDLTLWLLLIASVGLAGSFAMHESAHVAVLRRARGVTHICVERTWLRLSVVPLGELTPSRAAGVAAAGPLACVTIGAVSLWAGAPPVLAWCYLAHGLMLLPVFGDGRVLLRSIGAAASARGQAVG